MTHIWSERFTKKEVNPERCRAAVRDGGRWPSYHQCTRKPVVQRDIKGAEYGFCKTHDPVEVEAKSAAQRAQWAAEARARDERYEREKQRATAMDACKTAIEQIASGHNDPRALAVEALALFPDPVGNAGRAET